MVLGRAIVLDWAVAKEKYTTARTLVCPISFECSIIIVGIMLQKQVLKHIYIIFSSTDKDKKSPDKSSSQQPMVCENNICKLTIE